VVDTGVSADGRREVLGFAVGDSEDGACWTAFLRSLKARGLSGTKLVISGAHAGLKAAMAAVMLGATWHRSSANLGEGESVSLVHLRRRERTLAAGPGRSSGGPTAPDGGGSRRASGSRGPARMWEHLDERPEGSAIGVVRTRRRTDDYDTVAGICRH
jgi:hypothetical protein